MNIAIIINSLRIGGGAERVASIIGSELKRRGNNVYFVVFNDYEMKYSIEGEYQVLSTGINSTNSFKALLNMILRAKKIASFCRERKINACLSFMEEANFSSILSGLLFGNKARLVLSVRENPRFKKNKAKFLMKILHHRADMVVANSKATERILNEDFGLKKTFTVYNPVDVDRIKEEKEAAISPEEEDIFKGGDIFINVGRLNNAKGQWHLIRSFSKVIKFKPSAKLVVIGDGELEDDYREMIKRLRLENNIFLLGRKKNVFPYLSRSKCFVFASIWEGMPNALIEAAVLGLPIISTDCPTGPREVIAPELEIGEKIDYPYRNRYGILLDAFSDQPFYEGLSEKPLSDIEESFSSAILNMFNEEPVKNRRIQEREEFSLDNIIELWEMLIKGDI